MCFRLYNGRYLFEDLLQETYLAFLDVKPEVVDRFSSDDKLHYLGGLIIRNLFGKRDRNKTYSNGNTSPLYESCGVDYCDLEFADESNLLDIVEREMTMQRQYNQAQELISQALQTQNTNPEVNSDFVKVSVFLQANESSINALSKKSKIPRYYLTQIYKEGQEYLKQGL